MDPWDSLKMQENVGGPDQNTPVEVIHQSTGFPGQEYWSGLPFPSPGDLPDSGIKLTYPVLQVDSLPLSHLGTPDRSVHRIKLIP